MIYYKKNYYLFDIFKFLFALCIVFLHIGLEFGIFKSQAGFFVEKGILRLAVPFFFIVSGYLFAEKNNFGTEINDVSLSDNTKKYCTHLLNYFLIFNTLSVLLVTIINLLKKKNIAKIIINIIRYYICYPQGATWYLLASIIGMMLISYLLLHNKQKMIFPLSVLCYTFALLCNSYYFLVQNSFLGLIVNFYLKLFISARNGLFVGFFFLYLGFLVFKLKIQIQESYNINKIRIISFLMILLSYLIYLIELVLLKNKILMDDGSLFISLPILLFVFIFFISTFTINKDINFFSILRKMSLYIYLIHRPLIYIVKIVLLLLFYE